MLMILDILDYFSGNLLRRLQAFRALLSRLALFRLWFLPLAAFADECEDPNATSWIQMKLHYELTEKSDEG